MALRQLFDEDRGVSPVIGVILMVAITVILAAVIGSFVLGIGSDVQTSPQASLQVDWTDNTISHNGGDSLDMGEITIKSGGSDVYTGSTDSVIEPGDTIPSADLNTFGDDIVVVHDPSGNVIFSAEK